MRSGANEHSLTEQTILVTGATDGLGRGLAEDLARRGATVLLHGRDDERGERAVAEIRAATGNDRLSFHRADFSSLTEVRELAGKLSVDLERLDVLVNNAGVGSTLPGDGARVESADGYELRFAVNYLAPFLLTRLLVPLLLRSAPARVVNVASAGQARLDFDDLMLTRGYNGSRAYAQSKLAMIIGTVDLAEQLAGTGVTVTALHPGTYMPTKIVSHAGYGNVDTLESGIVATARLAVDPALEGVSGRYFDRTRPGSADAQAADPAARVRLRTVSEQLTGLAPAT